MTVMTNNAKTFAVTFYKGHAISTTQFNVKSKFNSAWLS